MALSPPKSGGGRRSPCGSGAEAESAEGGEEAIIGPSLNPSPGLVSRRWPREALAGGGNPMLEGHRTETPQTGTIDKARKLRREMSLPERPALARTACEAQRPRVPPPAPSGAYVLDFFCNDARLAIEIDGESHGMGQSARP